MRLTCAMQVICSPGDSEFLRVHIVLSAGQPMQPISLLQQPINTENNVYIWYILTKCTITEVVLSCVVVSSSCL